MSHSCCGVFFIYNGDAVSACPVCRGTFDYPPGFNPDDCAVGLSPDGDPFAPRRQPPVTRPPRHWAAPVSPPYSLSAQRMGRGDALFKKGWR
jgi:hypothetical protein